MDLFISVAAACYYSWFSCSFWFSIIKGITVKIEPLFKISLAILITHSFISKIFKCTPVSVYISKWSNFLRRPFYVVYNFSTVLSMLWHSTRSCVCECVCVCVCYVFAYV